MTVVDPPRRFGFRWGIGGLPSDDPRRTEVIFTLSAAGEGTRLPVVETGFAQAAEDVARAAYKANSDGWDSALGRPSGIPRWPCRLAPSSRR